MWLCLGLVEVLDGGERGRCFVGCGDRTMAPKTLTLLWSTKLSAPVF